MADLTVAHSLEVLNQFSSHTSCLKHRKGESVSSNRHLSTVRLIQAAQRFGFAKHPEWGSASGGTARFHNHYRAISGKTRRLRAAEPLLVLSLSKGPLEPVLGALNKQEIGPQHRDQLYPLS
jgi:hypothetical protein